ncbi:hypothetical protein BSKO_00445 [Bryopsis sp. KO-2023]|nr:hypothetical protein BSKO_00445 [Bryopsis sp. KO-2023]
MKKSRGDAGTTSLYFPEGFLPFLARDNARIEDPETAEAVGAINDDLGRLLKLTPSDFWNVVEREPSLPQCIDSYLRFRRRAYEEDPNDNQLSRAASQMFQRVFLVLLRLVTIEEGPGAPDRTSQAALLYENWILDIPKLLDVCVLFGSENRELVSQFLGNVFAWQPKYLEDLAGVISTLVDNLRQIESSCHDTIPETRLGEGSAMAGWPDALIYIQDVCVNLALMLELFPPSGPFLMRGGGGLLGGLAQIHDYLLPELASAVGEFMQDRSDSAEMDTAKQIMGKAHVTFVVIQRLSFLMLKQAYLNEDLDKGTQSAQVAEARGEAFMTAVLSVSQLEEKNQKNTLLHQINDKYDLGSLLYDMVEKEIVSIDDTQYQYLCMLMGYVKKPPRLRNVTSAPQSGPGPSPSLPDADNHALLLSKIAAIKEVLPDYGDGYLAACLKEFNMDPAQVMQHLLDGSLPQSLVELDAHLPLSLPGEAGPSSSAQRDDPPGPSRPNPTPAASSSTLPSTSFLPDDLGPGWFVEDVAEPSPSTNVRSWAQVSVGPSKPQMNRRTARVLGSLGTEARSLVLQQANSLLEYEDEYDDSFDDLVNVAADGLADAEGDGLPGAPENGFRGGYESFDNRPLVGGNKTHSRGGGRSRGGGGGGSKGPGKKLWLLNGKIYNYRKEGARQVTDQQEAERIIRTDAEEIHGLGAGGNKPLEPPPNPNHQQPPGQANGGGWGERHGDGGRHGNRGRGRAPGRGTGRGYGRKERNKASSANHNRKERAMRKMG